MNKRVFVKALIASVSVILLFATFVALAYKIWLLATLFAVSCGGAFSLFVSMEIFDENKKR